MPVLNERAYLEHAIASVLAQDVDAPTELVLALGPSTDGTTELARRLAEADDRIRLVENPAAHIPVGLNAAILASRYDTIVGGASTRTPSSPPATPPARWRPWSGPGRRMSAG